MVLEAEPITPRTRRLRIASEAFEAASIEPGADLVLEIPEAPGGRHYSVFRAHPELSAVDLAVVTHGGGPGSRWVRAAEPGGRVMLAISRPLAVSMDRDVDWCLFFGDETSVGSTVALVRSLPPAMGVRAILDVESPSDRWPSALLSRPDDFEWLVRGEARPGRGEAFLARLASLLPGDGDGAVYVTGEAWLCAAVEGQMRRTGLVPRARFHATPYWKLRKSPGVDAFAL